MPTITVGSTKTYASPQSAWDALAAADQGGDVFVDCDPEVYPKFEPLVDSVNKWTFRTVGQQYDGTLATESLLASIDMVVLSSAIANFITINDIHTYSSNTFLSPWSCAAPNATFNRLLIESSANNSATVTNSAAIPSTIYEQCIILNGNDAVRSGYLQGATKIHCLIAGASDKGVESSFGSGINTVDRCFVLESGTSDLDAGQMTVTDTATEDLTGTYTGYTKAECVDFDNRDFRTKATSPLATIAGGDYVGAFIESSGGSISIDEAVTNYTYESLDPVITLTGSISIEESITNLSYESLNPTIDLTNAISITESLTSFSFQSLNPTIELSNDVIEITESLVNYQYESFSPTILLTPTPIGILSTACFDGSLNELSFDGALNNIEYNGAFNELNFNGTIQTTCNTGSIKTNC